MPLHWSRRLFNLEYFFSEGITWSAVTSGRFSCRIVHGGIIPGTGSKTLYGMTPQENQIIFALLNSAVATYYLSAFSPTLNFEAGDVAKLPIITSIDISKLNTSELVEISKRDWDRYEFSVSFKKSPLLQKTNSIKESFQIITGLYQSEISDMRSLEERINRILIDAYSLGHEISPIITDKNISLTCNPYYRYGEKKNENELKHLFLSDTIRDFISYAVGCMFGRYSLDKDGLILTNQSDTIENYVSQIPLPSFMPDEDNVIPIIDFDGDWFEDDITERFKAFIKVAFRDDFFAENMAFIEGAIGKDIKKYFVKDFYADHVKRYKKRPIYWMFSSPKGSFNALIYMHRYQPDTASIVLNDYLREFCTKLEARKESYELVEISASASQKDITQAIKAIAKVNKVLEEVNDYEHDVLYPLAGKKQPIDLDDGVKHNYPLFGKALKKVTGLS